MNVLIVDSNPDAIKSLRLALEVSGHEVDHETGKDHLSERVSEKNYDVVFLEPGTIEETRDLVSKIRRKSRQYSYIVIISEKSGLEDAIKAGANDVFKKPLDVDLVSKKLQSAENLIDHVKRIGDDSEDFPSAGGVISKSAFNQLFLSAIERADRYGERTYVMFVGMTNYRNILELDGPYAADYAVASLSQYLNRMRRQSDIIAQIAKHEYALLLQRPQRPEEPMEAANRYAESLNDCHELKTSGAADLELKVSLIDLPVGSELVSHSVKA